LAFLTGEGRFLFNWKEYGGKIFSSWRPWIEYVLPAYYTEPRPEPEKETAAVFPVAGWVMAATGPPSRRVTFERGAGFVFQCRPRGGYSHSFYSDGSFQLHAYGQMLNHGGGSSGNQDAFAYHTMSHNTILIDGLGQAQTGRGQKFPTYGRIIAYKKGKCFVYCAGDVTRCYPVEPGNYDRWGIKMHEVYRNRALPYLERFIRHIVFVRGRYFVIYDDLSFSKPALYTWLYHILPQDPITFREETFSIEYSVGDVRVRLQHIAGLDTLSLEDRKGLDGFINPFTGEDYREWRKGDIVCGHNLWINTTEPVRRRRFLAVVYPVPPGEDVPPIEKVDDCTVSVGGEVVSFNPESSGTGKSVCTVDAEGIYNESRC